MANSKYIKINNEIRKKILEELQDIQTLKSLNISLLSITSHALDIHDSLVPSLKISRQIGWKWRDVCKSYRKNHYRRFELSIWSNDILCGLALGKVSKGKLVVKINYIEGMENSPLSGEIVPIVVRYAELFAVYTDSSWIAIQDPLKELIPYYAKFGFIEKDQFDPRNAAIYRKIKEVKIA